MTKKTDAASVLASMRKGNANAVYRIRNAMRVNPEMHCCQTSALTVQANEIRAEKRKTKAAINAN